MNNIETLNTAQFLTIGNRMFGETRWGATMARASGLSQASISNAMNGKPISKGTTQRIMELYDTFQTEGTSAVATTTAVKPVSPMNTRITDEDTRTDDEILKTIRVRFDITDRVVQGIIKGHINSAVVFGAPGVGKSFSILGALEVASRKGKHVDVIKGACTAPGLYTALYNARNGGIVAIDDCDSVFDDEDTLNILKSALDSSDVRTLSWRKASRWVYDVNSEVAGEDDDRIPNSFDFNGAVVFITNKNIKAIAKTGSRLAPHMDALVSRSHYIDLRLNTIRERMLRIEDVFINGGMSETLDLAKPDAQEIMDFVTANKTKMNELSLRALKIMSETFVSETLAGNDWTEMAKITQMEMD